MKNLNKLILGAFLLLLGVAIVLGAANIFDKWHCIIGIFVITIGLMGIFKDNSILANIFSVLIALIGLIITLSILIDAVNFYTTYIIGGVIVFAGVSFFISAIKEKPEGKGSSIILGSKRHELDQIVSENINIMFGSLVLDYRHAELTQDTTLTLSSLFGNIQIILPKNIKVAYKTSSFLSSFKERKPTEKSQNNDYTLTIVSDTLLSALFIRTVI